MCGLAGILNLSSNEKPTDKSLQDMITQVQHRGPDGYGYFRDDHVGLAHSRLSIIDIAGGQQPIHNETSTIQVVFNGEIFNYIELRAELIKLGHQFYTQSDTEVIVHAYEQYGDDFANHLNGQFAIAIWDANKRRLVLVRDRVGIHPLFYTVDRGRLLFASEIKCFLPVLAHRPTLSAVGLDQVMTFWSAVGSATVFEGINTLQAGEMLVVENQKLTSRQYWDWAFPEGSDYHQGSDDELAEQLRELLLDATRIRLRSDVPVGAYLSGGLDSSVLTALMAHCGADLQTFSIAFRDEAFDEARYQKQVIDHLGTRHRSIMVENSNVADNFQRAVWHTESPILRTAPVPMMLLSGLVRSQNYKVVLTGEGSDEVLGGYDLFKETKIRQFWAKRPDSTWRPLLLKKLYPYLDFTAKNTQRYLQEFFKVGIENPAQRFFSHLPRAVTTANCKLFFSEELKAKLRDNVIENYERSLPSSFDRWNWLGKAQYVEAKTLMAGYLLCSQGDRMLMSNSVEGRFPFLDHRVIEFANRLKPSIKIRGLNEKYILKRAMADFLPGDIVRRSKQPYRAPDIASFVQGKLPEYVEDALAPDTVKRAGYFDASKVELLLKKIRANRPLAAKDNMAFIGMLSTQLLHQKFIESR